ncbi:MAG: DUF1684 domain-containing protein [Anaerolineae bacterium]
MSQLTEFRAAVDEFMRNHPQSPFDPYQRAAFKGLDYYKEDEGLLLTVDVVRFPENEPLIQMETSTGDTRPYRRWGYFTFEVEGTEAQLTIYTDPHEHDFFLPFKDATNGRETYGAGRYLDNHRPGLQRISETQFEVNFNFAYNPYCAYSEHFSCPLPPRENWLTVPIRAGEKRFE